MARLVACKDFVFAFFCSFYCVNILKEQEYMVTFKAFHLDEQQQHSDHIYFVS